MPSTAATVEAYLEELPEDRKAAIEKLRMTVKSNLPEGFSEGMGYGMISYVIPHTVYPAGYHCNPKLPLPFISIASQKNFIALHHLGIYADKALLDWFVNEFPLHSKYKLDMGKGCIRFKNPDAIPFELIAQLSKKISVQDWIAVYETNLKSR